MTPEMRLGERIRELRKEKGFTQLLLSRKTGLSVNTISRYETDERYPTMGVIMKIADAFDMSVEEFLSYKPSSLYFNDKPDKPINELSIADLKKALHSFNDTFERLEDTLIEIESQDEKILLDYFKELNAKGRKEALKLIIDLTLHEDYTKE